jgi:putative aminopeptidase FrvX
MELEHKALLEELVTIQGCSSDEAKMRDFIIDYVNRNSPNWKVQPTVVSGDGFQDTIILVFGEPRTAVYAHVDTIGYSVGYSNNLIRVGGPRHIDGTLLVGQDSTGDCEVELMLIEEESGDNQVTFVSDREIDRGTLLSFKPNFRETEEYIQSPYMDNRLGVWVALRLCETLENGAIVFSTYEEHGGNSVGNCARYLYENHGLKQALISDITWVTHGVVHGGGVAISMRDSMLPRKSYLNRIIDLAKKSGISFQLEVESAGGSDGSVLQKSDLPIDWCFIGAPEDNVHTPDEKVFKSDIVSMLELYRYLMLHL